jgi:hypothetical protein
MYCSTVLKQVASETLGTRVVHKDDKDINIIAQNKTDSASLLVVACSTLEQQVNIEQQHLQKVTRELQEAKLQLLESQKAARSAADVRVCTSHIVLKNTDVSAIHFQAVSR